ncbi:MAG: ATP-dependent DNA helicase RecG [Gammaproteobacteria bacterium]|nr:ATP-dependent DNA helicase RecG [Gammaproteobacteria bacterium]
MSFSRLDSPVQYLKGVGPRRAENLSGLGIRRARDLLYHVPRRYEDASTVQPVAGLEVGDAAVVVGRVRSSGVIPTRKGLRIFQAVIEDETGHITCAWPGQPWLDRRIRKGDLLLAAGTVRFFHGRQIHPRVSAVLEAGRDRGGPAGAGGGARGTIFVVYPASESVPQWVLRQLLERNLSTLLRQVDEEEYLSSGERREIGVPGLAEALSSLHAPKSLDAAERGRRRLAWDELYFLQLMHAHARHRSTTAVNGIRFGRTNRLIRPLHESLGFRLTDAQARVLREIYADMTAGRRMNRMLQGDVGAGKTIVAVFAMMLAVEGGHQAALMAPTELLAEQHARSLERLLGPLGVETLLLTGRTGARERARVLGALADGSGLVVTGTHALIQETVEFARLGLVVVDEQHRFGVRQRMVLSRRDPAPDTLIMSATPIPRSLALALYGDLDLSVLDELPPGRKPVETRWLQPSGRAEAYRLVRDELAQGRQAYVVYPLVGESDKLQLRSATEEWERLRAEEFSDFRVGLLHGQLPGEERDAVMRAFLAGDLDVLVATSVVEVGIDVSNATVMLIEHAERFGLSQLHQLRGRVGRGADRSYCVAIADAEEAAAERLRVFRSTHDGFSIARADLAMRGEGDFFGSQQHGQPVLRFADLTLDQDLMRAARAHARATIDRDPDLLTPGNAMRRQLLTSRFGDRLQLRSVG